ncbi:MAG: hypothetical protein ACI9QD_000667 [Thermoproteota archaeon]|jgi:hypothetical protein
MKSLLLVLILFQSFHAKADFTLNNNISAGFDHNRVKVYLTSNSTCTSTLTSTSDLLLIISDAINNFWNKVPTSRLRLVNAGYYQTTNADFLNEKLCNPGIDSSCTAPYVPQVTDIIIACNDDTVVNFPTENSNPSSKIAVTLPNNTSNTNIVGSVILINDTADTPFKDLSYSDKVAVISHEIGHAFGLGHSDDTGSLMYYQLQNFRYSLGYDDVEGVSYLYPVKFDGCGLISSIYFIDQNDTKKNAPSLIFILTLLLGFIATFIFSKLLFQIRYIYAKN